MRWKTRENGVLRTHDSEPDMSGWDRVKKGGGCCWWGA